MRRGVLVLIAAGCSAPNAPVTGPVRGRTDLRIVRCAAALPAPLATSEGSATLSMLGRLDDELIGELRVSGVGGGTVVGTFGTGRVATTPAGNVSLGMPSTSGSLDAALIRRVVQARLPELRSCYRAELAANPSSSRTTLSWKFHVTQDGRVLYAGVTSFVMSSAMNTCVSRVFRTMTFPARASGGTITITYPLVFEPATPPDPKPAEPAIDDELAAWTPFALDTSPPIFAASGISRVTEGALRGRLGAIEACFGAKAPTGSLRAMLELDADGELASVRVGGLGHPAIEACVAKALAGIRVVTPTKESVEVACDLSRGDAQPWRTSPEAGYGVIAASRKQLRYGDQVIVRGALDPEPLLDPKIYLVVAEPDTPGSMLTLALVWANEGEGAMIALRDGAGAPLFLGMGRIAISEGDDAGSDAVQPTLRLGQQTVTACVGRASQQAPLAEPASVGALVQRVAAKCKLMKCSSSLVIAIDADAVARDLVEVTGAARRAGFERVLLGGEDRCHSVEPEVPEVETEEE